MTSWLGTALLLLFAMGGEGQEHGPVFLLEPPARLAFSNSTGARVSCAAHGSPSPAITWQLPDGTPVDDVPGLRQVLENGTLVFLPFSAAQYRQEVHAALLRCRAHNAHGAILSRDMRVHAVVWQEWQTQVTATRAALGGPALLSCAAPASLRDHASVAAWYQDDAVLTPAEHLSGPTLLLDEGWRLLVRGVRAEEARAQYACSVLDALTGERRRSPPATIEIVPMSVATAPRALLPGPWETSVRRGGDVVLPCLVSANPPSTVSWYRESAGGVLREVRAGEAGEAGGRYTAAADALAVRRAEPADAGRWACRAANQHGHITLRLHLSLRAHLTVHVQPHTQVVNSGGTATMNCTWSGWPAPRLEWLHDGTPVRAGAAGRLRVLVGGAQLVVPAVRRADQGVYQCVARSERDSAQASAELRLGDTAPELQYTFIEQVLRPGQVVTLKCSATGAPPPHFTWLLDGQQLNTMSRGHRYSVEQFATKTNDVVSYLNISSVRSEDGGLYTCRAANSLGDVSHTSRLNIYGPPYVRSIGPIRAVAGRELVLYCPYSGYPISSVKWERDGSQVEWDGNAEGALRLARVEPSHAGAYACAVSGPHGEIARRELQLVVSNPPEIEPFSFSANLQEGKRAQVSCSVTSGDMPVHFTWLKDNTPIPSTLQVEERGADFFSNLVFKEVSARHSGLYTCVASNTAAKVNYTAELVVKVSPKWVREPRDEAVLAGEPLALHCQATGSPPPQLTWLKQRVGSPAEFVPLVNLGGRLQFLGNGSLWLEGALPYDEGHYMCRAENGVGSPLTKTIFVAINEPARFELTSHNVSARRDAAATLTCEARGDAPLRLTWTRGPRPLDLTTYRLSISEAKTDSGLRSQLYISRAERQDSGVYKCQAVNAFGHSDHYIYLSVQEKPETPQSLSVTEILSRAVRLAWSQGFDGNSPLQAYTVQHCALSVRAAHWDTATTLNVSVHDAHAAHIAHMPHVGNAPHSHIVLTKKGDIHYEALLGNLKPHTAYMIRIAAINEIDRSAYTEPVVVKTQEEAPSEAPSNLQVTAGGPGELHVAWRAPARDAWHGDLLGYSVTCTELGPAGSPDLPALPALPASPALAGNASRTLTVNGWSATELSLSALKKFTRYEVRVRAFNGVAAGPASAPVTATTLEGVPESPPTRVSCSALSSSSIKVSWSPPPHEHRGGIIQGYKVIYVPLTINHADVAEIKRVTTTDTYLHTLHKYTNYSIQVLAFTGAGDGKRSAPAYCITEEDVPSAPEKIKALAYSSDSVLVSWLPPLHPNGVISHYTVYFREAGRLGKHSSFTVSADKNPELELMFQVRNLLESQMYEFWVSATTGSGEGESTHVVGLGPSSRIPARIASFGGRRAVRAGHATLLACTCVGVPAPRSRWAHGRAPVTHHAFYQVTRAGHLHIREVNEQSSGNFSCTASNSIGEDTVVYAVVSVAPPAAPLLSLQYTTASTVRLHWRLPADNPHPVLGYVLHYKRASESEWHSVELSPELSSYTMDMLRCGTTYNARIQAQNKISLGPPSEILTATTRGGLPKPPKPEEHVHMNSSAIKINFYAWRDGGCPILGFRLAYRRLGDDHWIKVGESLSAANYVIGALSPATWYEVLVEARNDAGAERVLLLADTHTLAGGRIPPPAPAPPAAGGARTASLRTVLVSCAASALVIALALAALLCLLHGKRRFFCLSSDHYLRNNRKLSESNEAEREKLREGQKLYSSSSINGNEKSNDDSSAELYEISPYATFGGGVGGGAGGGAAAHSLQFRTLARRDDDAAPPHRRRRRCDHYRYDESSLSNRSTVEARHRMRAACAGPGSAGPGGATPAGWRERSDSDDYSDSAANTTTKGSGGSGGGSAYGSGRRTASSGGQNGSDGLSGSFAPVPPDISSLIDKYQQRKEQERRECTIHV
ncbi:PREDICTED: Down syndrome cell adhesion molecule-like protein Dscam2 [Papilio polytes]|uniref:Down syndrome cell adhesion molecule-like protein Dscam2 n=1 Tax=Papilio polytes TaxID=76194 RepID=UPI000675F561|nr:PREDICTED: Down syndrome cell adhesion molecule-like protein Dscam2 [Papilio polytes]